MKRSLQCAVAMLAVCAAAPALGADYLEFTMPTDLRPAYPETWEQPDDSIRFEVGTRYWMSWGSQEAVIPAIDGGVYLGDVSVNNDDRTDIGELHGKIEDLSTQTYVRANAALGFNTSGTYSIAPGASSGAIGANSRIGYAGGDFGWMPLGDMREGFAMGGLIGYQYWKDAPNFGTGQYATSFVGGVPATFGEARDNFDIHALRLGVKAQAEFDRFDIQAEVAAVPYAHISGSLAGSSPGGFSFPTVPGVTFYERAPTTLTGRGYGVMSEAMVGFHPTENLVVRVGGRAWYLQGDLEAKFHSASALGDVDMNLTSRFASIFRYGALFELTGKF